jgi:2'-5' RNA ligase
MIREDYVMRMFVAVPVPDSVKQYARMIRNKLGVARADIKWVEYENYHLTLKFLGEVNETLLPAIKDNLARASENSPAFNLSAGGLGFFPNRMKPRVLWIGVKGEMEKAQFLGERVDAYLSTLGFEEERDHRFHLTLGRIRSDSRRPELLRLVEEVGTKLQLRSFKIEYFDLMQSSLTSGGPVYSPLASFRLSG